jgi:two-component system chemotaxis response regulator CheB
MDNRTTPVPIGRIVGPELGDVHAFVISGTVFVSCYNPTLKAAHATHLQESVIGGPQFAEILKRLAVTSMSVVKIVGPQKLCDLLTAAFKNFGVSDVKASPRETSVQIFFYPADGRLRVEKDHAQPQTRRTRVLIVDDSKTIRDLLEQILSHEPSFEVVGSTGHPLEVVGLVEKLRPDVITMDIHMPDMNGTELVKKVMESRPTPTVMITSVSMEDGSAVFTALENGAVDYIQKPSFSEIDAMIPLIIEKIKCAALANIGKVKKVSLLNRPVGATSLDTKTVVAIGSSTGGTEALREVLTALPKDIPPIVIVQHIPPVFSEAFAKRMNSLCPFEVKEAEDGDLVEPGRVLIAPGGKQMEIKTQGGKLRIVIHDGSKVNRHKPSVDVLFDSMAEHFKGRMAGIILTGMGADGAKGLLKMKNAGAYTIAQSEKTCVVFGMPREAIQAGAAVDIVDLERIPDALIKWLSTRKAA